VGVVDMLAQNLKTIETPTGTVLMTGKRLRLGGDQDPF